MKSKYLLISIVLIIFLTAGAPIDGLTQSEMESAIVIDHINNRPVAVEPGESVVYHVKNTNIYLEVYNNSTPAPKFLSPKSIAPLAEWDVTQTCGVNVSILGLPVATLKNRVNIHYYQDAAKAPAKFNWYDMSGTETIAVGFSWTLLSQSSNPAKGVRFTSSGSVVAQGTLNRCLAGVCGPQGTYSSRLEVDTSGTRCQ